MFFVISGFLITQIIVKSLQSGSFSFLEFYSRRIKRLLPAAFFMLLATLAVGIAILTPDKFVELAKSAVYTSVFFANVWFATNSGYFDQSAEISPLVHMWSLAVEEQFYLLVPFMLYAAYRMRGLAGVKTLTALIFIVSLALSILYTPHYPDYAFYLLPTRAWELSLGAMLVLFPSLSPGSYKMHNLYALVGFCMIGAGLFLITQSIPYPGSTALLPTIGTALLLASVNSQKVIGYSMLSAAPVVLIGKFSYSAYLWHWPVIAYYRIYVSERAFNALEVTGLVMVSMLLGYFSWRFIEEQFRHYNGPRERVFMLGAVAVGVMLTTPFSIYLSDGFPDRVSPQAIAITDANLMRSTPCSQKIKPFPELDEYFCVVGNDWQKTDAKGIIWGDSHSTHWSPLFDMLARKHNMTFVVAPLECPPFLNAEYVQEHYMKFPDFTQKCTTKHKAVVKWLNNSPDVAIIIMASAWSGHVRMLYTDEAPQNRVNSKDLGPKADFYGVPLADAAMRKTLDSLNMTGKEIMLLSDLPRNNRKLNQCAFNKMDELLRADCSTDFHRLSIKWVTGWHTRTEKILTDIAKDYDNISFISPVEALCEQDACPTFFNDELIYRDSNHLRLNLSLETLNVLDEKLGLSDFLSSSVN